MYLNFPHSSTAKVKTSGTIARRQTTAVATMNHNNSITKIQQQQQHGMIANNITILLGQPCLRRQSRMLVRGQSLAQIKQDNS